MVYISVCLCDNSFIFLSKCDHFYSIQQFNGYFVDLIYVQNVRPQLFLLPISVNMKCNLLNTWDLQNIFTYYTTIDNKQFNDISDQKTHTNFNLNKSNSIKCNPLNLPFYIIYIIIYIYITISIFYFIIFKQQHKTKKKSKLRKTFDKKKLILH